MFSSRTLGLLAGLLSLPLYAADLPAPQLTLTPSTCVTLQQGRQCHAMVQLSWRSPSTVDLCLYLETQRLQCWQATRQGSYQVRFVDTASRTFYLKHNGQVVSQQRLNVSWVQQNHRIRQWRRF